MRVPSYNYTSDTIGICKNLQIDLLQDEISLNSISFLDLMFSSIVQEVYNINSQEIEICSLTSNAKMIELHEQNLDGMLFFNQKNLIWEEDFDTKLVNESYEEQDLSSLILASFQPVVISLGDNNQEFKSSFPNTALVNLNHDKIDINFVTEDNVSELQSMHIDNVGYSTPLYVVQDIKSYSLIFNNEIDIEKYKSLNKAIHSQIIDIISMHRFKDQETIEIVLRPETLGIVKIRCEIGDSIVIDVSSDRLTTLSLLQSNASELKDIITSNIIKPQEKMEMSFSMERDNNHREDNKWHNYKSNSYSKTTSDHQEQISMYFSHNGVINFIV